MKTSTPKFRTAYDHDFGPKGRISQEGETSRTIQSAKTECDINVIIDRANRGIYPNNADRQGQYADVSDIPDYQTAFDIVQQTHDKFMELPAKTRDRFANDPQRLLQFLQDPENRDEAVTLGLINPPSSPPQKEPQSASPNPPAHDPT